MMAADPDKRKEGEHILNNYRKQLAERMAREKMDKDELLEDGGGNTANDFMAKRMAAFESTEVPDSNLLEGILNRKSKFDKDLK